MGALVGDAMVKERWEGSNRFSCLLLPETVIVDSTVEVLTWLDVGVSGMDDRGWNSNQPIGGVEIAVVGVCLALLPKEEV